MHNAFIRRIAPLVVAGLVVPAAAPRLPAQPPPRTWRDATGAFSVEARLIEQSPAGVKLRLTDGRVIDVALDRLSAADREYLQDLATAADPDAAGEAPAPAGPPRGPRRSGPGLLAYPGPVAKVRQADARPPRDARADARALGDAVDSRERPHG